MPGRTVPIVWNDRTVRAWVPDPLGVGSLDLDTRILQLASDTATELRVADARMPLGWEPIGRLMLRSEGVASSWIEGLRAPLAEVAVALEQPSDHAAGTVAANAEVVAQAMRAAIEEPLTVEAMLAWHHRLMRSSGLADRHIGAFRDVQGWIGGSSPLDAALVTPPPGLVPDLLADLVEFANRDDLLPVVQAAVVHAQFEVIHPFADGNGRIGRLLIGWVLVRRLGLRLAPAISAAIAKDRDGYLSGLTLFRLDDVAAWVRWVAKTLDRTAGSTGTFIHGIVAVLDGYHRTLEGRARRDAAVHRLVDLLPVHPTITVALAATALETTPQSARSAIQLLEALGVLDRYTPSSSDALGRPPQWWVCSDLINAVDSWLGLPSS